MARKMNSSFVAVNYVSTLILLLRSIALKTFIFSNTIKNNSCMRDTYSE